MRHVRSAAAVTLFAGLLVRPTFLGAHHEAIFGPQSSLVLSSDRFVSFQVFTRELGTADSNADETTTLVSAGVRVSKTRPLTFTAIVPYSWISAPGHGSVSGMEEIVLGLRYRHDLKGLQEKWNREGNFLMGVGAFELNNGTIDHRAWSGPADAIGAVLGSLERGQWSVIGYTVARLNVQDSEGSKDGNTVFVGSGLAYTPNEDLQTGRLFSYQLGWSFEHYARDRIDGQRDPNTGGNELLLHPTSCIRRATTSCSSESCPCPYRGSSETSASVTGTASEQACCIAGRLDSPGGSIELVARVCWVGRRSCASSAGLSQ